MKYCSECGQKLAPSGEGGATNISNTSGDVLGTGISDIENITAKNTKGNIFYFNIGSISSQQFKDIITVLQHLGYLSLTKVL